MEAVFPGNMKLNYIKKRGYPNKNYTNKVRFNDKGKNKILRKIEFSLLTIISLLM